MDLGLVAGVIALGVVHGVLPDHGWPIAATYALSHPQKWLRGTVAALILGIGHLVSSVALVLAYFWFSRFADFAEGPWMKPLAGGLLIALGVYEYLSGGHGHVHDHHGHGDGHEHSQHHEQGDDHDHHEHGGGHDHSHHEHGDDHDHHGHGDGHDHSHNRGHGDNHDHSHHHERGADHEHAGGVDQIGVGADGESVTADDDNSPGIVARIRSRFPGGGHVHPTQEHAEQGLLTLGAIALLLGFAHEEPIQILAICAGTEFCLELMLIYSVAVIGAILAPTLLLIAGYERHQERIERWTPHLPTITAIVLVTVGLWFVVGGLL